MINRKSYLVLLLIVSMIVGSDRFNRRSSEVLRQLKDLRDEIMHDQEFDGTRRSNNFEDDEEVDSNRRNSDDEDEEQFLELRTTEASSNHATGSSITLQNGALMNTRLRVLYTDSTCNPFILETGRLWAGQTKSVQLPLDAQHVKILIEKDVFAENWHIAYNGTLANGNQCLRIVGVTFSSKIHPCKN